MSGSSRSPAGVAWCFTWVRNASAICCTGDQLISTIEEALAAFSLGRVLQPVRNMLNIEEGKRYLGIMPAVAGDAMGAKLVSFYPGNAGSIYSWY